MRYNLTFCNPLKKDIIELGKAEQYEVVDIFNKTKWEDFLQSMEGKKESEIFYSPSFEVENPDNKNSVSISAVGKSSDYEFYIFYKRPKMVKGFLGLGAPKLKEGYNSMITGQSAQDVIECIEALINNNLDFLERKIK